MDSPLVTIIMPIYNAQSRLSKALECALNQSVKNFEFIAINDGSSDSSGEILRKYAQKFPDNMRLIECENSGASNARNIGLDKAKGEWIYFCDSDDEFSPYICEHLINLANTSNAQIASCAMKRIADGKESFNENENCKAIEQTEVLERDEILKRWLLPLFRIRVSDRNASHGYLPLCVFRRDIIESNKIRFTSDIKVHEDELFFLQYLNFSNKAVLSKEVLYSYIFHPSSASVKFFKNKNDEFDKHNNYYLAYKMRRIFWQKYMSKRVDFKSGLCELYIAELNHRIMAQVADKNGNCISKISRVGKILKEESGDKTWQILKNNAGLLSRKKRLFFKAINFGKLTAYIACKILLISSRH